MRKMEFYAPEWLAVWLNESPRDVVGAICYTYKLTAPEETARRIANGQRCSPDSIKLAKLAGLLTDGLCSTVKLPLRKGRMGRRSYEEVLHDLSHITQDKETLRQMFVDWVLGDGVLDITSANKEFARTHKSLMRKGYL